MDFQYVQALGLVKLFGATRALSGVDLRLEAGKVTVIQGHNGSGKSTLLSILAGLALPDDGEVRYGKINARRRAEALRGKIGVLAHSPMVYPDLSGRENLRFFAGLYGAPLERVESLCERFEIGRFADRPVRTYSRGQLQRIALARAVLHSPRLLLLDEPSTGLDIRGVERLEQAIGEERERGAILVLVTHDREFAKRTGDVHITLERGRVKPDDEAGGEAPGGDRAGSDRADGAAGGGDRAGGEAEPAGEGGTETEPVA